MILKGRVAANCFMFGIHQGLMCNVVSHLQYIMLYLIFAGNNVFIFVYFLLTFLINLHPMMVAYTVNIKYRRHYIKRAISYLTWEGFYYSAFPH